MEAQATISSLLDQQSQRLICTDAHQELDPMTVSYGFPHKDAAKTALVHRNPAPGMIESVEPGPDDPHQESRKCAERTTIPRHSVSTISEIGETTLAAQHQYIEQVERPQVSNACPSTEINTSLSPTTSKDQSQCGTDARMQMLLDAVEIDYSDEEHGNYQPIWEVQNMLGRTPSSTAHWGTSNPNESQRDILVSNSDMAGTDTLPANFIDDPAASLGIGQVLSFNYFGDDLAATFGNSQDELFSDDLAASMGGQAFDVNFRYPLYDGM